jgi:hypothetical protein
MLAKKQEAGHPLGDEACGTEQLSRQHEAHNQTRGLDALSMAKWKSPLVAK